MELQYKGKHQNKGVYDVKEETAKRLLSFNEWTEPSSKGESTSYNGEPLVLVNKNQRKELPKKSFKVQG